MSSRTSRPERLFRAVLAMTLAWGMTAIGSAPARSGEGQERVPDFNREIAPLLATHCVKCHGDAEPKGGLDLRTKEAMLKGGDSGPALTAGSADESLLFDLVSRGEMPPKRERRLSAAQVALIKDWLNAGTPAPEGAVVASQATTNRGKGRGREHWAFRELARPVVPSARDRGGSRTPVDAFVLARLEATGRGLSPDADRSTLVRRLYPRLDRPAGHAGGDRRIRPGWPTRRLRATGRSAPGLAAFRRALGTALARRRGLRGYRGLRQRRGPDQARGRQLAVPRLRHPLDQRGQALRPVPDRATGRR